MPPPTSRRRCRRVSRSRHQWLAAAGLVLFLLVYAGLVLTEGGRALDTRWADDLAVSSSAESRGARAVVRVLGPAVLLPASALVVLAAARDSRARAVALAVACCGLLASAWLLKVALPRPGHSAEMMLANSYPSGHVVVAATLVMAVAGAASGPARLVGVLAAGVGALLVAWAVVALQWHRPGDTVGSLALVLAWWGVFGAVNVRRGGRGSHPG